MPEEFFVQLYEQIGDRIKFTGYRFESADLGKEVPRVGDSIISPPSKAEFEPRNPARHEIFDVVHRYFLPDITKQQANIVKLLVKRRKFTEAELALWGAH